MAALCQPLLRLRDTARAALVVVHHVRKSIGRQEIGSAFRGSSALHAVSDGLVSAFDQDTCAMRLAVQQKFTDHVSCPRALE
jgi:hypothetical protein